MKVVLFCGGLGMRIRRQRERPEADDHDRLPADHVAPDEVLRALRLKDFILCLGYRADYIKNYFLTYNECVSNDFTLSEGGRKLELLKSDIGDWRITFVDTGLNPTSASG